MDIYSRKFIIMLTIAAIVLAYLTVIYYLAVGGMTYIAFRPLFGILLIVLTIITIIRKEDIEKAGKWFWKILFITLIIFLIALIVG